MRDPTTYIKLDRNIADWRWFKDPNTMLVWIWLLINANIEPQDFRKTTIERGEILCTFEKIAENTGLSKKSVRTAMEHLIKTGEIRKKGHDPKFPIYIIEGFSRYQGEWALKGHEEGTQRARKGHEEGTQRAPIKESKEYKEYKNGKNGKNARAREALEPEEKFDFFGYLDQVIEEEEAKERAKHEQAGNNADN